MDGEVALYFAEPDVFDDDDIDDVEDIDPMSDEWEASDYVSDAGDR